MEALTSEAVAALAVATYEARGKTTTEDSAATLTAATTPCRRCRGRYRAI
jgi:hypothetical protein